MRRIFKILAVGLAAIVLLLVVLGGAVLVAGNTDPGRALIERLTYRLSAGYVKLTGLGGSFPTQLTLTQLQLIDAHGIWLTANDISLRWSPLKLLERRIQVDTLQLARLHIERAPFSAGHGGSASVPDIEVGRFSAGSVELGAPLVGKTVTLSLQGSLRLRSLEDANAEVVARRLGDEGEYTLHLRFDAKRMDASLAVHEPASGPLENLLTLPGLGPLSATATLKGPRNAGRLDVALAAGDLHVQVQGSVDLKDSSADLEYSLTAPAMAPRPDLSWAAATLNGNWHGSLSAQAAVGRLQVDRLRIAGNTQLSRLTADLAASSGMLTVHAAADGLEIPGPQPRFFAKSPLKIDASLQLNEASLPLAVTATHPLLSLNAHAELRPPKTGSLSGAAELRIPDLAPYAVFTGQDVRGSAAMNARLVHRPGDDALTLDGNLGLTGGSAGWIGFIGPRVALQLSGHLSDDLIKIDAMRVTGRVVTLAASANATRVVSAPSGAKGTAKAGTPGSAGFIQDLQARWQLQISDLAALSSDVAGNLKMSGRLSGPPASMVGDADVSSQLSVRGSATGTVQASLHARGLPTAPSGTVQAHGLVDGAPLSVDAAIERSGASAFRLLVRGVDWKSAHVEGDLTSDAALTQSHGQLLMQIGRLDDLDHLLGFDLSGSVDANVGFVPAQGHTRARLQLEGKNLTFGQFAGDLHLQALGVSDALGLKMKAELPNLYGAPASLTSAAVLNVDKQQLQVASASVGYRGATLQLLAPAQLSFAQGLSIDDLKMGAQDAIFELKGQITPTLDLRASLLQVKPGLINVFSPGLLAGGTIEAQTQLRGSVSSLSGRLRLDATGIRFADDAATGLPPLDVHARAQLSGDTATVNAKLTAGTGSQLSASGTVPLAANGALNMKIGGKLDVGLANPLLEAQGMHAAGELAVDASVTGSATAPQVGGGITLAQGSLRDYGHGVNLSDITAEVVGNEGAIQIKSFKATAVSGTVGMTGTFGVLQPGLPLDLRIAAKNAQPVTTSIVTANLDADLHVSGTVRERLDVAGTIHVNRATIGIPNSLPPDVAVLDVRRRGRHAQAAVEKQLVVGIDVAVQAPQEILVQGRGLDAEMGGSIQLSGTSDALIANGGLDLLRGSFTLAGHKLTFTQGRVSFDGAGLRKKIDPTLDFTAQTSLATTTATLRITGVADAPRFDFSSSPVLPQDEIMAQLLFGENAASLTALQAAQIGAALATLSGVGGGGLNPLVKLQKSLGLDRLTVGTNTITTATGGTENSGAAIEAGRYISKRVYIEGKQTTAGTSQVQVDVDLTKHLKLQTRLGNGTAGTQGTTPENDPGSSIGLSYQFEY